MTTHVSSERQAARQWSTIFKIKKYCQPKILYPVKISFRNEGILRTL